MGFSDNDPTPVTDPVPVVVGFDPDDDPTPVQAPQQQLQRSFPDPFDGDTVVAEPVLDFEVSSTPAHSKTPGRPIPDVLRPPPSITDSSRVVAVDLSPEETTASTAPFGLDADELFDDVEDCPLPPPMMMDPPLPRQLPLPWRGSSALRGHAGYTWSGNIWIAMLACALAGAAFASAGFLIAGRLSESTPRPKVVQPRTIERDKVTTATAVPSPDLQRSNVGETEAAAEEEPAREAPTKEAPVERAIKAAPVADHPAVVAGKQLARAIRPCLRRRLNRSLRVTVHMVQAGTVRRGFVAKRSWLTPYHQRCIKRRLKGLKLRGAARPGYTNWRLTLRADSEEAVLLGRRGL